MPEPENGSTQNGDVPAKKKKKSKKNADGEEEAEQEQAQELSPIDLGAIEVIKISPLNCFLYCCCGD